MDFSAITGFVTYPDSMSAIGILSILMGMILFSVVVYVYFSLALMRIAQRTHTKDAWLAWIPVGNMLLMADIAKMPRWPVALIIPYFMFALVPYDFTRAIAGLFAFAFSAYYMIFGWKMCERRNRPGWWYIMPYLAGLFGSLIMVIGIFTLVYFTIMIGFLFIMAGAVWQWIMMGILAWGRD